MVLAWLGVDFTLKYYFISMYNIVVHANCIIKLKRNPIKVYNTIHSTELRETLYKSQQIKSVNCRIWMTNIAVVETEGLEDRYGVLIESSVRQQFAGPLSSAAAMQMLAFHFTLALAQAMAMAGRANSVQGAHGEHRGRGGDARRMFRCRHRKLRALHKS